MTQDRAYTAPPQYRRAADRSGAANVGPTQPTNWRRAMTQDRSYTAPPQYRRADDRSGAANVGGEPSWRGRRQPG